VIIKNADNLIDTHLKKVDPVCPVFGRCGGCQYQDIPYEQELAVKDQTIAGLFKEHLNIAPEFCEPIVPSPQEYHYRNRLDLKIMRTKEGILFGFSTEGKNLTVPIDACPIAMQAISDVIPQLRKQTTENLPPKYRMANLVVRADTEGKVKWGGIGRRSLRLKEDDYLSTELDGRRIFYSLETFFQANLFILPKLIDHLKADLPLAADTVFFDLYGGACVCRIQSRRRSWSKNAARRSNSPGITRSITGLRILRSLNRESKIVWNFFCQNTAGIKKLSWSIRRGRV